MHNNSRTEDHTLQRPNCLSNSFWVITYFSWISIEDNTANLHGFFVILDHYYLMLLLSPFIYFLYFSFFLFLFGFEGGFEGGRGHFTFENMILQSKSTRTACWAIYCTNNCINYQCALTATKNKIGKSSFK